MGGVENILRSNEFYSHAKKIFNGQEVPEEIVRRCLADLMATPSALFKARSVAAAVAQSEDYGFVLAQIILNPASRIVMDMKPGAADLIVSAQAYLAALSVAQPALAHPIFQTPASRQIVKSLVRVIHRTNRLDEAQHNRAMSIGLPAFTRELLAESRFPAAWIRSNELQFDQDRLSSDLAEFASLFVLPTQTLMALAASSDSMATAAILFGSKPIADVIAFGSSSETAGALDNIKRVCSGLTNLLPPAAFATRPSPEPSAITARLTWLYGRGRIQDALHEINELDTSDRTNPFVLLIEAELLQRLDNPVAADQALRAALLGGVGTAALLLQARFALAGRSSAKPKVANWKQAGNIFRALAATEVSLSPADAMLATVTMGDGEPAHYDSTTAVLAAFLTFPDIGEPEIDSAALATLDGEAAVLLALALARAFVPADRLATHLIYLAHSGCLDLPELGARLLATKYLGDILPALLHMPEMYLAPAIRTIALQHAAAIGDKSAELRLARAIADDPAAETGALQSAAASLKRLGSIDDALAIGWRLVERLPDDLKVLDQAVSLERQKVRRRADSDRSRLTSGLARLHDAATRHLMRSPDARGARLAMARALVLSEEYLKALDILSALVSETPDDLGLRQQRLLIAERAGEPALALEDADRLLAQRITPTIAMYRVRALRALDRGDDAKAYLGSLVTAERPDPTLIAEYVRSFFILEDFEAAITNAEKFLEKFPDILELRFLLVTAHIERDEADKAAAELEKLVAAGGGRAFPLDLPMLSYACQFKTGRIEAALEALDPLFQSVGCRPLRLGNSEKPVFDNLVPVGAPPLLGGISRTRTSRYSSNDGL